MQKGLEMIFLKPFSYVQLHIPGYHAPAQAAYKYGKEVVLAMIYFKKTKAAPIVMLVSLAAFFTMALLRYMNHDSEPPRTIPSANRVQTAEDMALTYIFMDRLQEQSNDFYAPYYTINPTISYYMTEVKEVKERGAGVYITFSTMPYIGPHDTVGEDEITFFVRRTGEITPGGFKHLKSYPLPENLSDIEKGELPPASG